MAKKDKEDAKSKSAEAADTAKSKTAAQSKGPFGHFEKMRSNKSKYFEKPQPFVPRGGRNGQGKP
jgi:hypothetical protein